MHALVPYYARIECQLGVVEGVLDPRYRRAARTLGLRIQPKRGATLDGCVWTALHTRVARRAQANVVALRLHHNSSHAEALEVIDAAGQNRLIRARVFVLAASPIETTRILLASELSTLSPQIGRNLVHHPIVGYFLVEPHSTQSGRPRGPFPGAAFMPRFVNLGKAASRHYQGGFSIEMNGPHVLNKLPPAVRKRIDVSSRVASDLSVTFIHGIGETSPHCDRYVDLCPDTRDSLGRQVPRIHLAWSASEECLVTDMKAACLAVADTLACGGGRLVQYMDPFVAPLLTHEAGTCAMGTAEDAPCEARGRLRALANVWAADASALPSAGDRHPTLTILAHALRVAEAVAGHLAP
jgi:choline dehydrogenase-like flavoprotein